MESKLSFIFLWPFLFFVLIIGGCTKKVPDAITSACLSGNSPCLQGKATVEMTTNRGTLVVEVYGQIAPVTAGNFLDLINKGAYERTVFHRVIKIPSPFVLQGGDPFTKYPTTSKINYGKGNFRCQKIWP